MLAVVTVGFSSNMYTVVESDGHVEVCVEAKSDVGSLSSSGFVTFSISVTPSTAGESICIWKFSCIYGICKYYYIVVDDFDASGFPMTGNITDTTSKQCFNVSITNDNRTEDTEMFTVRFEETNSKGSFKYGPINSTVSIEDDDGNLIIKHVRRNRVLYIKYNIHSCVVSIVFLLCCVVNCLALSCL